MSGLGLRVALSLFALAALIGLSNGLYFANVLPHRPIAASPAYGFLYPFNNHGVVHYVTATEHLFDVVTSDILLVLAPLAIIGLVLTMAGQYGKDRHLPPPQE